MTTLLHTDGFENIVWRYWDRKKRKKKVCWKNGKIDIKNKMEGQKCVILVLNTILLPKSEVYAVSRNILNLSENCSRWDTTK